MSELVSVVIPVYKVEKYLNRCVDSLCNQSYSKLQIILIDDSSPDSCPEICNRYSLKDPRISVIHNPINKGLATTRNIGLNHVIGKYVMFVDSDDFLDVDCIEKMVNCMEDNEADLVVCGFDYYKSGIRTVGRINPNNHPCKMTKAEAFNLLFDDTDKMRTAWAKLYRYELIKGIRFPDGNRFGEDMAFTPYVILNAKCIYHLNENKYLYNQDGESLVRSSFNKNRMEMVKLTHDWIEICRNVFPGLIEKAESYYILTMIDLCSMMDASKDKDSFSIIKELLKNEKNAIKHNRFLGKKDKIKADLIISLNCSSYLRIRNFTKKNR